MLAQGLEGGGYAVQRSGAVLQELASDLCRFGGLSHPWVCFTWVDHAGRGLNLGDSPDESQGSPEPCLGTPSEFRILGVIEEFLKTAESRLGATCPESRISQREELPLHGSGPREPSAKSQELSLAGSCGEPFPLKKIVLEFAQCP